MELKFGAHMSTAGGHDKAVRAAKTVGFAVLQLFTKNNHQWNARPLRDDQIAAFRASLTETGIVEAIAHNSYLINLAAPDDELWEKSIAAMVVELERAEALGIGLLVAHPGAHVGSGEDAGLRRIVRGIDEIHRRVPGLSAKIALETTAGQGTCLGYRFEHLGRILDGARDPERLAICADTCHLFAAGYSLETTSRYNETIEALDRAAGLARVRVWHLNDSLRELGSRVDRHAAIGRGKLGVEPFRRLVNDPRFACAPMILETPKGVENGEDLDVVNLRTLRGLLNRVEASAASPSRREKRASGELSPL